MKKTIFLQSDCAQALYESVADLPIVDYHCHLSPQEIYEDLPYDNIGQIWLGGDHYKWRLMRTAGVDEYFITGDAPWQEKFRKYASALEFAAGNPLYHWSHMELAQFFGINDSLTAARADSIWEQANAYIQKTKMSPRKLIADSRVETICTTDDIVDDLCWHQKLREDKNFHVRVLPSFRTDNLLLMRRDGYGAYLDKLEAVSDVKIDSLAQLKQAVINRLDFFVENGCRFTDVGIPFFPNAIADDAQADATFCKILAGEAVADCDYLALVGNLYVFLGVEYRKRNLVMQWHLSVLRNTNTNLFAARGGDVGCDCVGDAVPGAHLASLLDAIDARGGLPQTILYTLCESSAAQMASIAGAFQNVRCGAAWWFCDHKRGIENQIDVIAENSCLGTFLGMLTDSRSFLSYARHDYFRRILCNKIAQWVDGGEYEAESAQALAKKICYENSKEIIG